MGPIFIAFFAVSILSHYESWDPVLLALKKLLQCICRRRLSALPRFVPTEDFSHLSILRIFENFKEFFVRNIKDLKDNIIMTWGRRVWSPVFQSILVRLLDMAVSPLQGKMRENLEKRKNQGIWKFLKISGKNSGNLFIRTNRTRDKQNVMNLHIAMKC